MKQEKRTEVIMLRLSPTEMDRLEKKMAEVGVSKRAAFARKMALDGYCVKLDTSDVRELVRLLRICSNNLNQYARVANATGSIYRGDILDLQVRLDDIWELAKTIMKELSAIQ